MNSRLIDALAVIGGVLFYRYWKQYVLIAASNPV
jgi:hypothetical protein